MEEKRTLIQRKFINAYIKSNGNATEAYLSMHPDCTEESAAVLGHRMLRNVNLSIEEILDRIGVTDAYLSEKLNEGLNANKVISVIPIKPKESKDNPTDLPEANSKNIEFVDVNDFAVRHKYLDTVLKLKGKYPATKTISELTGKDGLPLQITLKKIIYQKDEEINEQ